MAKVIDSAFMNLVQRVPMHIELKLKNNQFGFKRSSSKGSSVEFSDYREYVPGDDFRRIDWNALARFEKVFIKLFMEEQESPVTIFSDQSKSMNFGRKREVGIKTAATFAYAALAEYDTVSSITFNEKIDHYLTNIRGTKGFTKVVEQLEKKEYMGNSQLEKTVFAWQPRFRKGITVIVSDLMFDHQLERILPMLHYRKQKVILCHVLSREEIEPMLEVNERLIDSETKEAYDIDAGLESSQIYEKAYEKYMHEIKRLCSKYGVHYFQLVAEDGIEPLIRQMLQVRE